MRVPSGVLNIGGSVTAGCLYLRDLKSYFASLKAGGFCQRAIGSFPAIQVAHRDSRARPPERESVRLEQDGRVVRILAAVPRLDRYG
ncbi:hypothetical protein K239x_01200 [Planctomycetes bacterium K23_9]|uniref:Uncharacterized protein n=1 Tax=Stieleria marina TaxID=1930275 RepID=A0A517NM28_9BACT|nr:hypothetical protein K239x_01200 [Planctomycetes bacterium K23_9]